MLFCCSPCHRDRGTAWPRPGVLEDTETNMLDSEIGRAKSLLQSQVLGELSQHRTVCPYAIQVKGIFCPVELNLGASTGQETCCWVSEQWAGPNISVLLISLRRVYTWVMSATSLSGNRNWQDSEADDIKLFFFSLTSLCYCNWKAKAKVRVPWCHGTEIKADKYEANSLGVPGVRIVSQREMDLQIPGRASRH